MGVGQVAGDADTGKRKNGDDAGDEPSGPSTPFSRFTLILRRHLQVSVAHCDFANSASIDFLNTS